MSKTPVFCLFCLINKRVGCNECEVRQQPQRVCRSHVTRCMSWGPWPPASARAAAGGRDTDTLLRSLTDHQLTNRGTAELLPHGSPQPLTLIICWGALGFSSSVILFQRSTAENGLDHTEVGIGRGFITWIHYHCMVRDKRKRHLLAFMAFPYYYFLRNWAINVVPVG